MQSLPHVFATSALIAIAFAGLLPAPQAHAQSDASQVSALSMEPSAASAAVILEALPAGSKLIVTALRPVGNVVELSVESASRDVAVSIEVSAATARATGLVVGSVVVVTAVSAGFLISAGAEAIAFVPDALCRSLTHHREL